MPPASPTYEGGRRGSSLPEHLLKIKTFFQGVLARFPLCTKIDFCLWAGVNFLLIALASFKPLSLITGSSLIIFSNMNLKILYDGIIFILVKFYNKLLLISGFSILFSTS